MSSAVQLPEVSSSSTLWATASKEWVIPAKPKPGRKPKNDTSATIPDDPESVGESKARRTQNRAAQRAFRERKQSHLAELQARIQMYEQGEIERNIALQSIAKKLKEENEVLRKENGSLKEKLATVEAELDTMRTFNKKRVQTDDLGSSRKRSRLSRNRMPSPYLSSSSSVSSAESPHLAFSPLSLQEGTEEDAHHLEDHHQSKADLVFDPNARMNDFNCGFCNDNTPCVCREVVMQNITEDFVVAIPTPPPVKIEGTPPSENLPAYQAPVPLRRRRSANRIYKPVIQLITQTTPTCSGDPKNCAACSSDDFGKAFCEAVNESIATPCDNCPGSSNAGSTAGDGCCGRPHVSGETLDPESASDMIPCDDAWRQLKQHPNVEFSDLSLLADVVARRSRCTGPRVVISPAPFSVTPERGSTPAHLDPTDERHKERSRLVPEDVLRRSSRESRVRTVHVDAVEAALRVLDAKSSFYRR